jgi:hypothetical protein
MIKLFHYFVYRVKNAFNNKTSPLSIQLHCLMDKAKVLGLSDVDLASAHEFLSNNEFVLCFDTIISQMYEYDIEINTDFYTLVCEIANKMNFPMEEYILMKDLIRGDGNIPKSVKQELAKILLILNQSKI